MNLHRKCAWFLIGAALAAAVSACGDDPAAEAEPSASAAAVESGWGKGQFACESPEQNDWEMCNEDERVQWCHDTGEDTHFHTSRDCSRTGKSCIVDLAERTAYCLDSSTSCEPEDSRCEDGDAYRCVNGSWADRACSTAEVCVEADGVARCVAVEEGESE